MKNLKTSAVQAFAAAAALAAVMPVASQAKIVRLEITQTTPAFGGRSFGKTGPYERVVGKAYGEIDPQSPDNAMIQDLAAAPKNARGMVEYSTDIDILRPADRARSNGVLFFNILNRGNKVVLNGFNRGGSPDPATENDLGDRFLMRFGFTIVWVGWEFDLEDRPMTMKIHVPAAADHGAITGIVRATFTPNAKANDVTGPTPGCVISRTASG